MSFKKENVKLLDKQEVPLEWYVLVGGNGFVGKTESGIYLRGYTMPRSVWESDVEFYEKSEKTEQMEELRRIQRQSLGLKD